MTLKTPFNMIISGASGSGKPQKVMKILKYKDIILDTTTKKVIFFYSEWQDSYEALKELKLVDKFIRGIPPQEELMAMLSDAGIQHYTSKPHQLLIFDDLVLEIQDDLMSSVVDIDMFWLTALGKGSKKMKMCLFQFQIEYSAFGVY